MRGGVSLSDQHAETARFLFYRRRFRLSLRRHEILNGTIKPRALGLGTAYWLFGLVTMFGALLVISLFVDAVDRGLILSMQYLFAYFLLPLILLARPWHETETLMKVFVASMMVGVLHGIHVVFYAGETNTTFVNGAGRLQGFVEGENECGSLFALTVPMVLSKAATRMIHPIVAVIVLALLGYGIMLTGSNSALYAMLFGLGLFAFASLTTTRIFQAVICVLVLWAAIACRRSAKCCRLFSRNACLSASKRGISTRPALLRTGCC